MSLADSRLLLPRRLEEPAGLTHRSRNTHTAFSDGVLTAWPLVTERIDMSRDERIAARLIAAIDSLVPAYCSVSIDAGRLEVAIEGTVEVSIDLAVDARLPDREAVLAFNVLNTIQDAIVRTSRQPWPPASEPTFLACPAAEVRQGLLVAWYGSEAHPVVAFPPIDLATA